MLRYIKARSSKALARASFRITGLNPEFLELRVQFSLLGKLQLGQDLVENGVVLEN